MAWGIVIAGFMMAGMMVLVILQEHLAVLTATDSDATAGDKVASKVAA
jgi:hypothetical protein